jgi:hypothetical protein
MQVSQRHTDDNTAVEVTSVDRTGEGYDFEVAVDSDQTELE